MDRCTLNVNLKNIEHNFFELSKFTDITAVVKCDAYGLGAKNIVKCLENCGAQSYAVATVYEGCEIRKYTNKEIIVLGFVENWEFVKRYNLIPVVYDEFSFLMAKKTKCKMYIKINTGMNRLGFRNIENFRLDDNVLGFMSHFMCADGDNELCKDITKKQYDTFMEMAGDCDKRLIISNSSGLLRGYLLDGARVGIALYGISNLENILPVVTLKSVVIAENYVKSGEYVGYSLGFRAEKDMKIAVVSIGYGDGIPRNLSNKLAAFVRGQKIKSVGFISMDSMTFDITGTDIRLFDEVTIIGNEQRIEDVARISKKIPYELLINVAKRVKRVYNK